MTSDTDDRRTSETQSGLQLDIHPIVFFTSAGIILAFVVLTMLFARNVDELFAQVQATISFYGGWFFIATLNIVLIFVITLLLGRFGNIRIGGEGARPEFSTKSWYAMLFSAGMGIGVLFYGVAEPMFHFTESPIAEAGTVEAARMAMDFTFLHWGLHPWSVYALVGLSLAFFAFNKGLPLSVRSAFYPLIGERIYGWPGHVIDILATVATMFGVATSLGLGAQQINAGFSHLVGLPQTVGVQLVLITGITAIATWSVIRGLDAGIKRLSHLNMILAGAMLFFVLLVGPTLFILNALIENFGYYVQQFAWLSTWNETYEGTEWQNGWTIFYWGWWISWSPFVGMFIARISYGRTVREFVKAVLFVPTIVTFLWMTVFGNSALNIEMFGAGGIAAAVEDNLPVSLFVLLEHFPLATVTSSLALIVVVSFFVTSSDSASLVIDIITAGGNLEPPRLQRIFWAVLEGVVAAALLIAGGLVALQTAAITTGLPFAVVLLGMCWALRKGFDEYLSGQTFTVSTETCEGIELRTRATRSLPTFGRRRIWIGSAPESSARRKDVAER